MLRRFVVLIAAALPAAFAADTPKVMVVEEIAAKVNGDIITRGELTDRQKKIEQFLRGQGLNGAKLTEAVKQQSADALRDEIDSLLLVQKGKDLNLNVESDVNKRIAELQVTSKITDTDKFHDWVREQSGMTFEDYKEGLRKEFLTQRVIGQEVASRINTPDPELRKYYEAHKTEFVRKEQVFLSQILLSTEGKSAEQAAEAEKKAKDLAERARKGEKFSDLARSNSDDLETSRNGGQLPPFERGLLQKDIENIVFTAKKGLVTDPIKVPQGFVILRVDERHEAGQASFEEVRNDLVEIMARPRMEPRVREFLTQLRQTAFLEIKDGYTDSGAAPGKDTRWQEVAQLKPQTTTKEEVAAHRKRKLLGLIPIGTASSKHEVDTQTLGERKLAPAAEPASEASQQPAAPAKP